LILGLSSKLIRGDESAENENGTSSPSDGASCSESLFLEWGDTFEEAVLAVIDGRERDREEASSKYIKNNPMTPEQMANEIKNGRFPYAGLNRF
jgi:hypothetical protein